MTIMIGLSLTILDLGMIFGTLYMAYESSMEREQQAVAVSMIMAAFHVALMYVILYQPGFQWIPLGYFGAVGLAGLLFLIPRKPNPSALNGIRGYVIGDVSRPDERDTTTNRNRLIEGTPAYDEYYSRHPEAEEVDRANRMKDRISGVIDDGYRPNVAMIRASFSIPSHMKAAAFNEPAIEPYEISPEKATMIAKNLAKHLGVRVVGVCKVDPLCVYTNQRTNWEKTWTVDGVEQDYPPYARARACWTSHSNSSGDR